MARLAHVDSADTRRRILAVAIERFSAAGFHGASTREIAGDAKVNVATLAYHFSSKQGVYEAAVDEVYRRLGERVVHALSAAGPLGPDTLGQTIAAVYDGVRAERVGVRILVREALDFGGLTSRTHRQHFAPTNQALTEHLATQLQVDPEAARMALVALNYLMTRYVTQEDEPLMAALGVDSPEEVRARVIGSLVATTRAHLYGAMGPSPKGEAPSSDSHKGAGSDWTG